MGELNGSAENRPAASNRIWDEVLRGLSELEAEVVRLRFGLSGDRPLSLTRAAKALKITRERIRKIERKALNRFAAIRSEHNP